MVEDVSKGDEGGVVVYVDDECSGGEKGVGVGKVGKARWGGMRWGRG
jgi:hypothetical protein